MARHCVARTSRTCVVPMPKAMAPTAPWVEVWLSPQAMVMPGWLSPSSGPITWTMPCLPLAMSKSGRPNSFMFLYICSAISSACGSGKGRAWSSVGMMWSSVPKVRSGMRTLSFSSLSIWKAWGVVTSWMRWRPIRSWVWPDGSVRTVWVGDHVVGPPANVVNFGETVFDPLVTLAVVAGATRRVRLGTTVLIVPYRNAVVTAKMIASLDALSGGRVVLGIGAGWVAAESAALGVPFAERGAMTDEYVAAMQELWTSRAPSFAGKYTRFGGLVFEPKPLH